MQVWGLWKERLRRQIGSEGMLFSLSGGTFLGAEFVLEHAFILKTSYLYDFTKYIIIVLFKGPNTSAHTLVLSGAEAFWRSTGA